MNLWKSGNKTGKTVLHTLLPATYTKGMFQKSEEEEIPVFRGDRDTDDTIQFIASVLYH